jgi:hypothetical protein
LIRPGDGGKIGHFGFAVRGSGGDAKQDGRRFVDVGSLERLVEQLEVIGFGNLHARRMPYRSGHT